MATTTPIEVTAEVKQYTLVGDDIYVKRYTNENIPTWYSDMVSTIIAGDNTIADQSAAIAYLESLAPGYSISITQLQDKDLQIDTVLDSLVTTTGDHTAAISSLDITKVDETEAAAVALDTIGAYFADGSAASYFNSYISTYASNIAANASSLSTLSASLGSTNVRIDTVEEVTIDEFGYSLGASKLGTAPDGSITGWQFLDGTGIQSEFKIKATNFSISDGTTGYTPFSITGTDINFLGKVTFDGLGIDSNSTTIDGGKITTNSLSASKINTIDAWIDGRLESTNYNWGAGTPTGFGLFSTGDPASGQGYNIVGAKVYGAYINGGVIDGAVLTGEILDISTMKVSNGTANTAAFSINLTNTSSILTPLVLYGINYGTGYLYNRCLLASQKIMCSATAPLYLWSDQSDGGSSGILIIQYSINGGAYTTLATGNAALNGGTVSMSITTNLTKSGLLGIAASSFSTLNIRASATRTDYSGTVNIPVTLVVQTTNI